MVMNNFEKLLKMGAATAGDHLLTPSGKHATKSFTKYKLYRNPKQLEIVSGEIAKNFLDIKIDVVIGVSFGGGILSQVVALSLGKKNKKSVLSFYLENKEGEYILRDNSNINLIRGKKVLLVDDTYNSGNTIKKAFVFITKLGAEISGVAVICSRSGKPKIPKFYCYAWYDDAVSAFAAKDCKLCKKGVRLSREFGIGS